MKKAVSVISLRALTMFLVSLLVVAALAFAVGDLLRSRAACTNAMQLTEENRIADGCLQAVKDFAFERGRSKVVLLDRRSLTAENRRFIDERRRSADARIGEVLAHLPGHAREQGAAVERAWENVKNLRPALEADFVRQPGERDPALPGRWLGQANALVVGLEALLAEVSRLPESVDARFERLSALRILAVQFRSQTGSESNALGVLLSAGKLPGRETIDAAKRLRGRSLQLWSELEAGVERLGDPQVTAALAKTRQALGDPFRAYQDAIIAAADRGRPAPVGVDQYVAASVPALDATIEFAESVSRATAVHTQKLLEQARRQAFYSLAGIIAILLLSVLVVRSLMRRFTRPLNEILERIDQLLHAQGAVAATSGRRPPSPVIGDEFERVRYALEVLEAAMAARLQSAAALHESERVKASILSSIPQAIIATAVDGTITVFSPGAERMLGYAADEVVGRQTPMLFHDPEEVRVRAEALELAPGFAVFTASIGAGIAPDEREWTYLCKDGRRLTVLLTTTGLYDAQGGAVGCLGVATDISERKKTEDALRRGARERDRQNNLLSALLKTIPVGVVMVEAPSGKHLISNDAARLLLGRDSFPDVNSEDYSVYKLPTRVPYPDAELPIVLGMQGLNSHVEDMLVVTPDGSEKILEVMGSPVRDSEGLVWASVVSFIDITGRSQANAEMSRLAYYDHLTRLPNRRLFHDRMQMALTQARRDKSRLALLLIDLDRFKPVNDNLGHSVGDLLLKAVAKRMQKCLRESDTLARVGGDEFVVILPRLAAEYDALRVSEKIRLALNEPFELDGGYKVSIACSIGVAIYPDHGKEEKRLLKSADDAMYKAKEIGRNGVYLFTSAAGGKLAGEAGAREQPVMRLVWHRSFRSGDASIDQEHHELFDRANTLIHSFMAGGPVAGNFAAAISELIQGVAEHFANEELILARHHYAELDDHVLKHQRLLGRAFEMRGMAASGELTLGELVNFLAYEVVVKHILTEDRKYFPLLGKAPSSERPELVVVPREH